MDQHQAGQEEALMEVRALPDRSPPAPRAPAACPRCFPCVLAAAAVLALLLAGSAVCFFLFAPSCHQDAPPAGRLGKVNITCTLTKTDQEGKYTIFTTRRAATYLIYGWVKVPSGTRGEITLKQTCNGTTSARQPKRVDGADETIFFSESVKSRTNTQISLFFSFQHIDSSFHVDEL